MIEKSPNSKSPKSTGPAPNRHCRVGLWTFGLWTFGLLICAGCAKPAGIIFEPLATPIFWPPPPDPARVHYVGSIRTDQDLKPRKSFGRALDETFFGRKAAHSMLSPYAVCTDDRHRLFVCDSNAQVVHVFNFENRKYEQWSPYRVDQKRRSKQKQRSSESDEPSTGFSQPVGIAFDASGGAPRLFVSDSLAATIFVFDDSGRLVDEIGHEYLERPCGLAIDHVHQRLFVADAAKHQIVGLDFTGQVTAQIGERGVQLGQFNYPTNVTVDAAGRLFVSDSLNFRVQVFDSDLRPIRQIGRQGDMPGYFSNPKGLALDSENHLYVVDAQFEAVQIFDTDGQLLMTFGEEGQAPGQFWLPAGIHIDSNDRIWIADPYNRRVQVFDYRPEVAP